MKCKELKAETLAVSLPLFYVQRIREEAQYYNTTISSVVRAMAECYWERGVHTDALTAPRVPHYLCEGAKVYD